MVSVSQATKNYQEMFIMSVLGLKKTFLKISDTLTNYDPSTLLAHAALRFELTRRMCYGGDILTIFFFFFMLMEGE